MGRPWWLARRVTGTQLQDADDGAGILSPGPERMETRCDHPSRPLRGELDSIVVITHSAEQLDVFGVLPGAVMVAVDHVIVYANRAALELFGVADLAALVEREASRAHVHPGDAALLAERLAAMGRGEFVSGSVEYRIVRLDGTVRIVEWTTLPLMLGDRHALLYAVDDVTESAGLRDALRASELRQREVLATLAEGVIVVDRLGVCRDANRSAAQLLGLHSPADLIGLEAGMMPLLDADGAPLERSTHPLWRALDGAEHVRSEFYSVLFPQQVRRMRLSVIPMSGVDQPVQGAVVTFDDVTEQLAASEQIARNEERFRQLAAIAPVAVFETDPAGVCTYVNERWCEFGGCSVDGAIGSVWTEAAHPHDRERLAREWSRGVESGQRFRSELRFLHPDGASTSVFCEAAPIVDETGGVAGWIGSAMDVTAELALREGLRDSEARFRLLVEHSPDVVVRISYRPWRFDYVSPSIVQLTGRLPEEFYANAGLMIDCIHPDDLTLVTDLSTSPSITDEFECRIIHIDGSMRTVEVRRNSVVIDGVTMAVEARIRDITLDVAEQRRLDDMAHRDELTGLPNRRALMAALDGRLAARQPTSVIFLDLDGFKLVNDTHGHDVGDSLLEAFADRLTAVIREDDFAARLGGDEFVVIARPDQSEALAERVVRELASPFSLHGHVIVIGISAGVTNLDTSGPLQQSEGLLHRADRAMYEAKRRGKGCVVTTT